MFYLNPIVNSIFFCISSTLLFIILIYKLPNIINRINASFQLDNTHFPGWIERHLRKFVILLFIISIMSYIEITKFAESNMILQIVYISLFLVLLFTFMYYASNVAINQSGLTGWVFFLHFWGFVILLSLSLITATFNKFTNLWTHFIWSVILVIIILSVILLYFYVLVRVRIVLLSPIKVLCSGLIGYAIINSFVLIEFGIVNFYNGLAGDTSKINEVEITHILYAGSKFLFSFPSGKPISDIQNTDLIPIIQYYFGVATNLLILPFILSYFVSVLVTLRSNQPDNQNNQ